MPGPDAGFDQGFDQDPFNETPPTDSGSTQPGGPDSGFDQGFDQNPFGAGPGGGSAGSATTYTLSGPAFLVAGQIGEFAISLSEEDSLSTDTLITIMMTGVEGTLGLASVVLPASVPGASATFTFKPFAVGVATILVDSNLSLIDPSPLVVVIGHSASFVPTSYPRLMQGTTGWLKALLTAQLIQINQECAALIVGEKSVKITLRIGLPRSIASPTLCIMAQGSPGRNPVADHSYLVPCRYRIQLLVPYAGDDTASDFEIARQIVSDNLTGLFLDEGKSLRPTIQTGTLGPLQAYEAMARDGVDLFPFTLPDKRTVCTGFEIPWQVLYPIDCLPG